VMLAFYENVTEQLNAIEDCLERRRIIACLCLIYSAIDVIASLERRPNESTKAAFVRWVSENMSKARPLPCTPLELYAARCGILHTFAADSDLSRHISRICCIGQIGCGGLKIGQGSGSRI
jgi:hypothetical protein